jgi:hypothetical protein
VQKPPKEQFKEYEMPTVTSANREEFNEKEMAKKKGLTKKKEEKNKHEHLRASGFKELSKDYEFAKSHEMSDKTKHGFNVKYAGSPEKYHVKRSVSFPGLSGASEKMGEYGTPEEVTNAVEQYMKSKQKN